MELGLEQARDCQDSEGRPTTASSITPCPPGWPSEDPITPTGPARRPRTCPSRTRTARRRATAHYWDVWHGRKPFTAYRTNIPRFMSEFGFQSLPPLATIAHLRRASRLEHDLLHHGAPPAQRQRQRPDDRPDDRHLPHAQGLSLAGLPEHGAAGRGHPLRRGALAAQPAARGGHAVSGSSTTAGRSLPGPAWITSAAGRRCTTPPAASTRRCCSRSSTRAPAWAST